MFKFIGVCATAALLTSPAAAVSNRCRVTDPTGTPLNLREFPNGAIAGHLRNGALVTVVGAAPDHNGKPWVHISDFETGRPLGWVFREFVSCF
jgi:hypothetical protein